MRKYRILGMLAIPLLIASACGSFNEAGEGDSSQDGDQNDGVNDLPPDAVGVAVDCSYNDLTVPYLVDLLESLPSEAQGDIGQNDDFIGLLERLETPLTQLDIDAQRFACELQGVHLGASAQWDAGNRLAACNAYKGAYERSTSPGFDVSQLTPYIAEHWSAARSQIALGNGYCQTS